MSLMKFQLPTPVWKYLTPPVKSKQQGRTTGSDISICAPRSWAHKICIVLFSALKITGIIGFLATAQAALAIGSTVQTDQVKAELIAYAPQGIKPGQTFWLGLRLSHQPEWHTYWKNPGDSGLPTQLSWNLPNGFHAQDVLWPVPSKLYVSNLTNYGYEGTVLLVAPISAPTSAPLLSSSIDIGLHANWLICKQECVPQEGDFHLKVPVKSSSAMDGADFSRVLEQQAVELSNATQVLELKGNRLVGELRAIPKELISTPFTIFPELSEVITDPRPQPTTGATKPLDTQIDFALHPMRSTQPSKLGALIVFQKSGGGSVLTRHTTFEIKGVWPQPEPILPPVNSEAAASVRAQDSAPENSHANSEYPGTPNKGFLSIFKSYPFLAAMLGALIGGMILNLMPCVLPILAIKVLSLAAHSQDTRLYRRHSSGYAVGVIFCFSSLGGLVVGLKTLGLELGWGFQLQSPVAVAGLSFLFLLIALNLLGVFQIHFVVPNRLLMIQSQDPGVDGFLSGLLSVVVAAPCTAPFMGASLGWAVTAANWQGLFIFVCLGAGMALPILAISYIPALGRFLPKPGAWMNTMRVFLAFPMLLTVTWLLWVFGQQIGLNEMALLMVALVTFSALIFCSKLTGPSKTFAALFFAVLLMGEYGVGQNISPPEQTAVSTLSPPPSIGGAALGTPGLLHWEAWSPELVEQTLAEGRPVFVDFTAAWCITCQVNERTTLQNETIKSLLIAKNVRLLRADWTQPNAQIASALASLGRNGIPVYLLLSPQKPLTMLSELLNLEELTHALDTLDAPKKI